MTTALRRRRGTTADHATFTGLAGELTVDTDKNTVVVHDGATQGGHPLALEEATRGAVRFDVAQTLLEAEQRRAKINISLDKVDNTRDDEKPISTPVAQAIAALMPKSGGTFTGNVILPDYATSDMQPVPLKQLNERLAGGVAVWKLFQQIFTISGTFTVPPEVYSLRVTCVGGGGAGSHMSGGGHGRPGSVGRGIYNVQPGQTYTVSVGVGGTSGRSGIGVGTVVATPGTPSSFGNLLNASGGGVGGWYTYYQGTASGASGTTLIYGDAYHQGYSRPVENAPISGITAVGAPGLLRGGGGAGWTAGAGAFEPPQAGISGSGAAGLVIVEWVGKQ